MGGHAKPCGTNILSHLVELRTLRDALHEALAGEGPLYLDGRSRDGHSLADSIRGIGLSEGKTDIPPHPWFGGGGAVCVRGAVALIVLGVGGAVCGVWGR